MATTQKKRNVLATIRDKWIEGLIFWLCVVIGVLGFFGVLDGIPFFNGKIPSITLILLAILTGYVAFTQHDKQESFQENISDGFRSIFERLDNSSTVVLRAHPFSNIDAALEHTRKQITLAKQQVLVVYPDLNPDFHRAVPTTVFYKQIFTVEPEKITNYQRILPQHLPRMPRNFSYACLRLPKELLQCFVIIDEKELIILSDLLPISTRNLQFIKVYRQSFNKVKNK